MAIEQIPVGTTANDGTGIAHRDAFILINGNFQEVVNELADVNTNGVFKDQDNDLNGSKVSNVRPPIKNVTANYTLVDTDKDTVLNVSSGSPVTITLPNSWQAGHAVLIRRRGAGDVAWTPASGATMELPASRSTHTTIAEQYDEVIARVVENTDGASAIWFVGGNTA